MSQLEPQIWAAVDKGNLLLIAVSNSFLIYREMRGADVIKPHLQPFTYQSLIKCMFTRFCFFFQRKYFQLSLVVFTCSQVCALIIFYILHVRWIFLYFFKRALAVYVLKPKV